MPPNAIEIHARLSEDMTAEGIELLRASTRAHLARLLDEQRRSELIAVDLAQLLSERLDRLLADAGNMPAVHRAAVVGAARYFVSADDVVPDSRSCTGLDDDVTVFNHLVGLLGRPELRIED